MSKIRLMKIVFTDYKTMNPGDIEWEKYFDMQDVTLYEHTSQEELVERVKDAEIIVSNKTIINKETINACSQLKCVCISATGFNNVDSSYAASRGIPVLNAANYSDASVAQHVLAMVLNVLNKIAYYSNTVHKGRWEINRDFTYYDEPIEELSSKTVGFIGFGSLGKATAKLFKSFGSKIVVKEYPHRVLKIDDESISVVDEKTFFEQCDIISIHTPLNENTKDMVNEDFLNRIKQSAILVNTSRGGVINEVHLAKALKNRKLRAACLDVLSSEPPVDNPLVGIDNCYITPHQAWASKQARMRLMHIVSDNIEAFKKGKEHNRVN
jgi:glycerate dehydrogenase